MRRARPPVAAVDGERPDLARELGRAVLLFGGARAAARRSRTSSSSRASPSASASAASSARPSMRSARPAEHVERVVAGVRSATRSCGVAAGGSAISTTRSTSSGALAASALRVAWIEKRDADDRHPPPSRGARGAAGSPATARPRQQQVDDRRVDRPALRRASGSPPRTRAPAHGGSCSRPPPSCCSTSRPAATAGSERSASSAGSGAVPPTLSADLLEVLQAEAPAEDRRVRQERLRLSGSCAARRWIRVCTADGTSRSALRREAPRRRRSAGSSRRRGRRGPAPRG